MAKQKKQEPMITYTEILSRAIRQMEAELESWETRMAGKPGMEEYIEAKREELCPKIEAAKTLCEEEAMERFIPVYLNKWGCYEQVHSPKKYRSLSGFPVDRNPIDYPYSYDEYVTYKAKDFDESKAFGMYSDRMLGYDREKYNAACQQVWDNQSQSFDNRTPEDIERFLCIYLDKTVKLTAIVKGCNASSGFPYLAFLYEDVSQPWRSGAI